MNKFGFKRFAAISAIAFAALTGVGASSAQAGDTMCRFNKGTVADLDMPCHGQPDNGYRQAVSYDAYYYGDETAATVQVAANGRPWTVRYHDGFLGNAPYGRVKPFWDRFTENG
jgi:hypothetical protein